MFRRGVSYISSFQSNKKTKIAALITLDVCGFFASNFVITDLKKLQIREP